MANVAYHFNSTPLAKGSIILPGNWGRIVRNAGKLHQLWAREARLEAVRVAEFSSCPSRYEAAFFFEKIEEAYAYGQADLSRYVSGILYRVWVLQPNAPRHHADWGGLSGPNIEIEQEACRRYWRGDLLEGEIQRRETLSITPMEIDEAIICPPNPSWPNWL